MVHGQKVHDKGFKDNKVLNLLSVTVGEILNRTYIEENYACSNGSWIYAGDSYLVGVVLTKNNLTVNQNQ